MQMKWTSDYIEFNDHENNTLRVEPEKLRNFLWKPIESIDITLLDILKVLDLDPEFWVTVLDADYLPDLLEGYKNLGETGKDSIENIEMGWSITRYNRGGVSEFSLNVECTGFKEGEDQSYSISLSRLEDIANAKIRIKEEVKSFENYAPEGEYLGNQPMRVIELLYGLFYEITFYGSSSDKSGILSELNCRMDDIKSGKAKLYSWDEIRDRLKKRQGGESFPDQT